MPNSDPSEGVKLRLELSKDAPVPDRPRYFNRMSRSMRVVSPELMEVRSYNDMRIRLLCWTWGFLSILIAGVTGMFYGRIDTPFADQIEAIRILIDYHAVVMENYHHASWGRSVEEYLASMDRAWPSQRDYAIRTLFYTFMFALLLWPVALLYPRRAPLRIDRKRWDAYTLLRGELAVSRIDTGNTHTAIVVRSAPPPPLTKNADPRHVDWNGPLLMGLIGVRSDKRRVIWMGAQPATNLQQSHDIGDLICLFADDRKDHTRWIHMLRRRSFLPGDIIRALDRLSLRRGPNLDDPALQAQLEQAIPTAIRTGDPILTER